MTASAEHLPGRQSRNSNVINAAARFATRAAAGSQIRPDDSPGRLAFLQLHTVQQFSDEAPRTGVTLPPALETLTPAQRDAFEVCFTALNSAHQPTRQAFMDEADRARDAGTLPEGVFQFFLDSFYLHGDGANPPEA
jgi:hypothetical protein